jgi:acetylornithine deacetylase/succinyl-diaminopimelate desuccinylase-like protein
VDATRAATATTDERLRELTEFLRIQSISSDGRHGAELEQAAEWLAALVGGARVMQTAGSPIVDGTIPASAPDAPTVVAYGHYDVQAPGDLARWTTPPFEPEVRDGWMYARGVSDDKGNLYALVRAALDLAAAGELPVNVRVLADGEEEVGGTSIVDHVAGVDDRWAAAIIFDAHMVGRRRPAITTSLRGLCGFQLRVVSAEREVHSGLYGSAAANPVHDLQRIAGALLADADAFAVGAVPPTDAERRDWAELPAGDDALRDAGARPADERAGAEFYERVWARPSLTVHSIAAGDPTLHKTSIVAEAHASLSLRLAPGQDAAALARELERRIREACPPHATLELAPWNTSEPARVSPGDPVLVAAFDAIERATGVRPLAIGSGGSIPIASALIRRGTPTILTGFGTAEDNIHSPDERLAVEHFEWAVASARELFRGLRAAA